MRRSVRSVRMLVALAAIIASVVLIPSWSTPTSGKGLPRLFDGSFASRPDNPREPRLTLRGRRARAALQALDAPALSMNLFDNTELTVTRDKVEHTRGGGLVWHGRGDDGSQAVLTVVNGALAGTLYRDGQTYDVVSDGAGLYRISELDSASFPTDDPQFDITPDMDADAAGTGSATSAPVPMADGVPQIDMLVVWTPAARNAVGGTQAAIQSLVQSAVANANLAYSNSGISAHLNLVHSEEVSYVEQGIDHDLSVLVMPGDGILDVVQSLRNQYGADVVTLLGKGYAAAGSCGLGYIMSTPAVSFERWAYNVVDQSCAAGYLSYAHEVGHNQGLDHDPANSAGGAAYSYAHGYQDPGGAFRTVLSYGGAQRVPFFSNPNVLYNGRVTGTATQNNAAALNLTAPIVAQFRPTAGSPPPCTYTVSPTAVGFSNASSSASVTVTTTSTCAWAASSSAAWVTVTGSGTGNGSVTVTAQPNTGAARSATVTIAGVSVAVNQAAAPATCSYTVSPASVSFSNASSSANVTVTTTSTCTWTASSSAAWLTVIGSGTGNGSVTLSAQANTGAARSATLTIAGKTVAVSQAAAPACTYSVTPASLSFSEAGDSATVSVSTTSACSWTASSGASWVTVTGGGSGNGSVTVSAQANTGAARSAVVTVAGVAIAISQNSGSLAAPGAGALSGAVLTPVASVDLTTVGTSDWVRWFSYDHKVSGGGQLSSYKALGSIWVGTYTNDLRRITWTDGTLTAVGNNTNGIYIAGVGNGFQFTAPADATTRTLTVYVGGWKSTGQLTASLSDGSAPAYLSPAQSASGQYDGVYQLTYQAASPGAVLTVQWKQTAGTGNVTLQAVALR